MAASSRTTPLHSNAVSSVAVSGNTLSLSLAIQFKASFADLKLESSEPPAESESASGLRQRSGTGLHGQCVGHGRHREP